MNTERLKDLVSVLRTVPDAQFALETWWRPNCNTVGCAVGHYANARPGCGLELVEIPGEPGRRLEGHGTRNWYAVEDHFDLNNGEASYLFCRWSYPDGDDTSRADVTDRITDFIASGGVMRQTPYRP